MKSILHILPASLLAGLYLVLAGCGSGGKTASSGEEALYLFDDGSLDIPQDNNRFDDSGDIMLADAGTDLPSLDQPGEPKPKQESRRDRREREKREREEAAALAAAEREAASEPVQIASSAPATYSQPSVSDSISYQPQPAAPSSSSRVRTASVSTPSSPAPSSSSTTARYTVQPGDTLSQIARRFGTSVSAIKSRNSLSGDTIYVGQKLTLSGSAAGAGSAPSSQPSGGATYTVQRGDTLWAISRSQGASVTSIKNANGLSDNIIQPGQRLKIPR